MATRIQVNDLVIVPRGRVMQSGNPGAHTAVWDTTLAQTGKVVEVRPCKPRGHAGHFYDVQADPPNTGIFTFYLNELTKVKPGSLVYTLDRFDVWAPITEPGPCSICGKLVINPQIPYMLTLRKAHMTRTGGIEWKFHQGWFGHRECLNK